MALNYQSIFFFFFQLFYAATLYNNPTLLKSFFTIISYFGPNLEFVDVPVSQEV